MAVPSDDPAGDGVQYLAKCVVPGTVLLHAVHGRFRSLSSSDIVFGKESSIELVVIDKDGRVRSICDQPIFGTIKDMKSLCWNEETLGKDILVVLSDSGKLSLLTFSSEMHRFFPISQIHLSEPGNSIHQLGRKLAVHSSGFVAVSAYEGQVAVVSISLSSSRGSRIETDIFYSAEIEKYAHDVKDTHRISISGSIWSICFVSNDGEETREDVCYPLLAMVLHRRGALLNELLLLECDPGDHSVRAISQFMEVGPLALDVTEVPWLPGFSLLFRLGDILMMDFRDPFHPKCIRRINLSAPSLVEDSLYGEELYKGIDIDDDCSSSVVASALLQLSSRQEMNRVDDPMCIDQESDKAATNSRMICSWCWEVPSATDSRLILCSNSGDIFLLGILCDSVDDHDGIHINISDCLHRGVPYKVLLCIEGGYIAALADIGDGMVLKLENESVVCKSLIQNIGPIFDFSIAEKYDEKQDQMFACCGLYSEGSLRIVQSGISVERLVKTDPIYQGVTGTWSLKMKVLDLYHSFLVLSFVGETRVLKVGVSFSDVTDAVGFKHDVCTIVCGLAADGVLVQIYKNAVGLCLPTTAGHHDGVPLSSPITTLWKPENATISLGSISNNHVIVATSNPSVLFVLGIRSLSSYNYQIFEVQRVKLHYELSCICIPWEEPDHENLRSKSDLLYCRNNQAAYPRGFEIGKIFAVGTHKPSVEILSLVPGEGCKVVAIGSMPLTDALGTVISGCIPQDVKLLCGGRLYVLAGLRNGMLLRFEWPAHLFPANLDTRVETPLSCIRNTDLYHAKLTCPTIIGCQNYHSSTIGIDGNATPIQLELISSRKIGITPVFLVPFQDSVNADIIVLSDRPWLLQTARQSLSYTSITFQPSTHVTPICSEDCPSGILFVSENCLHLVEMAPCKRLSLQKISLGGIPRKIIYCEKNRLLLVMRTKLNEYGRSDICCVDPIKGSVRSLHTFTEFNEPKCMQLVTVGHGQFLVVGTGRLVKLIMPNGEAESSKGHVLVFSLESLDRGSVVFGSNSSSSSSFQEIVGYASEQQSTSSHCCNPDNNISEIKNINSWNLKLVHESQCPGTVLAVCKYLDNYFIASAGNTLYVFGFLGEYPHRLKKLANTRTRFTITSLASFYTQIAVGDCRDGLLFYSYHEDLKKLELCYADPMHRLIADCALVNMNTAVVSDRKGGVAVLLKTNRMEESESPERNLMLSCSYYMGETVMSIRKGSFSYRLPNDDPLKNSKAPESILESMQNSVVATTMLGSVYILIPISREEHDLLALVQNKLATHSLTAPVLGNDHRMFRRRGSPKGASRILDGDMLIQFLELTSAQQEAILAADASARGSSAMMPAPIPISKVAHLLECIHYTLC